MQISQFRVSNVRGIAGGGKAVDITFPTGDDRPQWVVLAGRNGVGKSTILQSIALAIAGTPTAFRLVDSFDGWIHEGADTGRTGIQLTKNPDDHLARAGRWPDFDPWVGIEWNRNSGPEPTMDRWVNSPDWDPAMGPWADNVGGWFLAGYGPFRRLSAASSDATRVMMTPGRPGALASLFREDASLSESVQWLQQDVYLPRLEGDQQAAHLEELVLKLLNDGLLPDAVRVDRVDSKGLWVRGLDGNSHPLNALSDGYRTVTGLVLDIVRQLYRMFGEVSYEADDHGIRIQHSGVVLIDEIDIHLHVTWQRTIGDWLKRHFPSIQFVVTTHSPFVCQAADPGGLIRITPASTDEPGAVVVEGEDYNRVVNGTIDDALLTDLFGLETTLSDSAAELRHTVARLEAQTLVGRSDINQQRELDRLRRSMPSTLSDDIESSLRQVLGPGR